MAAVTVNVLGRSPRGQQWCRATVYASLTFVIGCPQGVTVVRQARQNGSGLPPVGGPLPGRLRCVKTACARRFLHAMIGGGTLGGGPPM